MVLRLTASNCDVPITELSISQGVSRPPRFQATLSSWEDYQQAVSARTSSLSIRFAGAPLFENLGFSKDASAELSDDVDLLHKIPLSFHEPIDPGLNRILHVAEENTSLRSALQRCFTDFAVCSDETANARLPAIPRYVAQRGTPSLTMVEDLVLCLDEPFFVVFDARSQSQSKWLITSLSETRTLDAGDSGESPIHIHGYTTALGCVSGLRLSRSNKSYREEDQSAGRDLVSDILTPLPIAVPRYPEMAGVARIDRVRVVSDEELVWNTYLDIFDVNEWWRARIAEINRRAPSLSFEVGHVSTHSTGKHDEVVIECTVSAQSGTATCHSSTQSTGKARNEGIFAIPFSEALVLLAMPVSFHSSLELPVVLCEIRNVAVNEPESARNQDAPAKLAPFFAFGEGLTLQQSGNATISLNTEKNFWTKNKKASIVLSDETVDVRAKL